MAPGLVDALWVAGYEAELPDRTTLVSGETVVKIGEAEARESDNWEVVRPKADPKPSLGGGE